MVIWPTGDYKVTNKCSLLLHDLMLIRRHVLYVTCLFCESMTRPHPVPGGQKTTVSRLMVVG